jgi:CRISPR locus-related DNA-binding protein
MVCVLITTVYSIDSIVRVVTKFSAERLYLLIDNRPNREQEATVKKIKESFGKVIEIKEKKVEVYNVVSVAQSVTELIDAIPDKDEIYVNITPSRKTQAIGLLLGAYKRNMRVRKVIYMVDETKELISLPILSFDVSSSQLKILECIGNYESMTKLADDLKMSRAMLYRNIKTLKDKGLIEETCDGLRLTDAGKIAKM